MVSIARVITVILGGFGTNFLYEAYKTLNDEDINDIGEAIGALLGAAIILFFHLIVILIAFPFMIYSIVSHDNIPKWFAFILSIESILNSILAFVIFNPTNSDDQSGFMIVLLELIPVFMLLLYNEKIGDLDPRYRD
ncbi:MAG: hypothetical protein ACXAC2_05010 [Candidatus Kariarchaeaceae archaeon]|jgi:hypothetical protein